MKLFGNFSVGFPLVIAFFGPDGAGKSTQARLMTNYLRSKGFKVRKAWVRSPHTFAFLLWKLFMRLNLRRSQGDMRIEMPSRPAAPYVSEDSYGIISPITMEPPFLNGSLSRRIWSMIEFVSVLPVLILQVYMPLFLGYIVVAERYVIDTIATVAYFVGSEEFVESRLAELLMRFIPKGMAFIFLDADYKTIVERRGDMAGAPDYTDFHRRIYCKLAPVVNALRIDTSKLSVEQSFALISRYLGFD